MKKIIALILSLLVVMGVMTACTLNQNGISQSEQSKTVQQNAEAVLDDSNYIGEEKAKEIALQKAGVSAADVIFDRVELDKDDGVWQYEVEFRQGRTEYDADIKADDGTILSWDMDSDD